jgi:ribonuclease Z
LGRRWLGLLVALAALAAAGYALRSWIALRLMERAVAANLASDRLDELPDGLHVVLCGAGSPLADPKRSGPCTAVVAGRRLFVVDAGAGASRRLSQLRMPQGEIDAVLLTHFHSDHIDGLGELLLQRWVNGSAGAPVPVHGPEGVEAVVEGFALAYRADQGYRVAHHGQALVPPAGAGAVARPFRAPDDGQVRIVIDDGDLRVSAFRVSHAPVEPAVGYRFDYGGRSLVISGDTTRSANLARFASGVDLLVHEALAPELVERVARAAEAAGRRNAAEILRDIPDYHTTPREAAEIARDAKVGFLLYSHIVPPLPIGALEAAFTEGVAAIYPGPVAVGRDGTAVHLPAGSRTIELEQLL